MLIGLSPVEEDELIRGLRARITGPFAPPEDESITIEIAPDRDDQMALGGPISVRDLFAASPAGHRRCPSQERGLVARRTRG